MFDVPLPGEEERRKFFEDLILIQAAKAPASKREAGKILGMCYVAFLYSYVLKFQ